MPGAYERACLFRPFLVFACMVSFPFPSFLPASLLFFDACFAQILTPFLTPPPKLLCDSKIHCTQRNGACSCN